MSSLAALQQRLFELHGMSPSTDRDAQIAVLFSDLHWLMQSPSSPVPAPTDTMSFPVATPAPTPIYSNVLSRLVPDTFASAPVLPREEPPLPSPSSTVPPIDLTLKPSPKESAPMLPVPPNPASPSTVLTLSSPVNGVPLYFPSKFWFF